ncbi:Uncharacterised protein [Neisseria meningitidis]|nr:Uncharacterised protein [Neisseria meningitidis]
MQGAVFRPCLFIPPGLEFLTQLLFAFGLRTDDRVAAEAGGVAADFEYAVSETFGFGFAQAVDVVQPVEVLRHFFDKVAQGFVAENHIGGDAFGFCLFHTPNAQCLPQAFFAFGTQPVVFEGAGGGLAALERTQHHFGFAFEDFFGGFGQLQCLISGNVDGEVAEADALADDAAPFFVGQLRTDAEGRQLFVPVAAYPIVAFTAQKVGDVTGGKTLSGAVHAAE